MSSAQGSKLHTKRRKDKNYSEHFQGASPASIECTAQFEKVAKEAKSIDGVYSVLLLIFRSAMIRFRNRFCIVLLFALISGGIAAYIPQIMGHIVNDLFDKDSGSIVYYLTLFLGCNILKHLLDEWITYTVFYISTQVEDTWKYLAVQKFYSLPLAWHDVHDSGKTMAKISRATGNIWYIVCWLLGCHLFSSGVSLVIVLVTTLYTTPQLWWLWISPIIIYILANKKVAVKTALIESRQRRCEEDADKIMYDAAENVRCVKAFHRGAEETLQYALRWGSYHVVQYGGEKLSGLKSFSLDSLQTLTRVLLIGYCWHAGVSVGEMTTLIAYQELLMDPVQEMDHSFTETQRTCLKVIPLFELVTREDTLADSPEAVSIGRLQNEISFTNVSFDYREESDDFIEKGNSEDEADDADSKYDEDDEDDEEERETVTALRGISLRFPAGATTALVGRSGAGKSTLVMLLLRFYDPSSGEVSWDSTDLRDASRESLHRQIAWVPQETSLFNRSISDNIGYSKPGATRKEIIEAAKRANAHEFILETPFGYDSVVGERGVKLSGGQRQRIAIARALLANPSLLIFDECTSQLDSESERAIQNAIRGLKASNITQVVIAHRLSTILHADQIVVLDKGGVLDVGKHAELLERCALYKKFYSLQFRDIDDVEAV